MSTPETCQTLVSCRSMHAWLTCMWNLGVLGILGACLAHVYMEITMPLHASKPDMLLKELKFLMPLQ